jgi:hypothetical protein
MKHTPLARPGRGWGFSGSSISNPQPPEGGVQEDAPVEQVCEWGQFFPPWHAPFGYQLTVAHEQYPLKKDEALSRGYLWSGEEVNEGVAQEVSIPDVIDEVSDDVLNQALVCTETGKSYKIIDQELKLYRQLGIPLPDVSHYVRMRRRFGRELPQLLFDRQCMKCSKEIKTAFSSDRPEIVYCEECYLKEVS